jgi:bacillolysin
MKNRLPHRLVAGSLLLLSALFLWWMLSRPADPSAIPGPPQFDVSALQQPGSVATDSARAQAMNKAPDLLDRARAAQAQGLAPMPERPDQIGRQIAQGLRNREERFSDADAAPLHGRTRGTGRAMLSPSQKTAVDRLWAQLGDQAALQMDPASGTLRHLRGNLAQLVEDFPGYANARSQADYSAMALGTLAALDQVLNVQDPATEFVPRRSSPDELGMRQVRLDQHYAELPIYGAQVIVHFDTRGDPIEVSGVYAPTPHRLGTPRFELDEAAALEHARRAVDLAGPGLMEPAIRRVLYWSPRVSPVPAYAVDLVTSVVDSWEVMVSAADGEILHRLRTTKSNAVTGHSNDMLGNRVQVHGWQQGAEYLAIDTSLPMYNAARSTPPAYTNTFGAICIFDVQNRDVEVALREGIGYSKTGNLNQWDATAVSMMSHFTRIWHYYRETHNRNSFDDRGINLTALIHARFKNPAGQLYNDNAFFNPNLNLMVFGDGQNGRLPAALDIAAHELTHGVVDNSAAFRYENQPGALHEHMADFFACMIDRDDWLVGEDAMGTSEFVAWRDMSDPHNPQIEQKLPKTMAEYRNLPNTPDGDFGGVHINVGIPNYASYLFTAGANGMGRDKAEKIVYRALTRYMTQYSEFVDYRRACLSAAQDLHPGGNEAAMIAAAFDAVQILDGGATPAPTPVPPTAGQDRTVFLRAEYDEWFGLFLGYALYVIDPQGYQLLSDHLLNPVRPAVSGDGTWALYVAEDGNVYWTDGSEAEPLTDTGDVRTIALSKDLQYVAFTTMDFAPEIHLLDTHSETIRSAVIEVTTSMGENVRASFADVLSFNCTGDILYFDAWTEGTLGGADYGCWGLFFLRPKDLQCHTLLPLSPGLQVGNPSSAHTLPHVLLADYVYTDQGQTTVGMVALDPGQSQLSVLLSGLNVLATPTFLGDDRQIVFRTFSGGTFYLNQATLTADRSALVEGSVSQFLWSLTELTYPVGFRTGAYTPPAGRLEVSPASLDFDVVQVGATETRALELRNTGNADLELLEIRAEGSGAGAFRLASPIQKRIPGGQSQTVTLACTPQEPGVIAASLRFKSSTPGQSDVTIELQATAESGPPRDYWREIWQDYEDHYSYFDHKNIDWPGIYEATKQSFEGLGPTQFAIRLSEVLEVLHDWHVYVQLPDSTYRGYQTPYPRNYLNELSTRYTVDGAAYANLKGANAVYHARLTGNVAHIIVDTLSTSAFNPISDADINTIFALYHDTDGLVLDIRGNNGGNEANAVRFAARLTDTAVPYGHVRYRQPQTVPYQFDPFVEKTLTPATSRYLKPTVGLIGQRCMSSAEWFALMLQASPNTILIGDRTRGASGNPLERHVPELNISYSISQWIAYDDHKMPFEDRGIEPAVHVTPDASYDDGANRDLVLEKALAYLEWRQVLGDQLPRVSSTSDHDGDGRTDVEEWLAGTDPTVPDSHGLRFLADEIRVRPEGGLELRWISEPGRQYHLLRATRVTGPWHPVATGIPATPPTNVHADSTATTSTTYFYRLEQVQ